MDDIFTENNATTYNDPFQEWVKKRCLCQHGTAGPNCERCLPDHWDIPWKRGTSKNANECLRKQFICRL